MERFILFYGVFYQYMKKIGVLLIATLVIVGCVLAAGCTTQVADPSMTISVTKIGDINYNIGDTFSVTLPSNPTTGYDWYVSEELTSKGLSYEKEFILDTASEGLLGAGGSTKWTFTAKEAGEQILSLLYMRNGDDSSVRDVYSDKMIVVAGDHHSNGSFVFSGNNDISPKAGSVVLITCAGNPGSTGYQLVVDKEETTVNVLKEEYVAPTADLVGAPGLYQWYVTADVPGAYVFYVLEKRGDEKGTVKFFVPLIFTIEE